MRLILTLAAVSVILAGCAYRPTAKAPGYNVPPPSAPAPATRHQLDK